MDHANLGGSAWRNNFAMWKMHRNILIL